MQDGPGPGSGAGVSEAAGIYLGDLGSMQKIGKAGMKVETPLGSAVQHWPQPCPLVLSEGGDVRAGTFGIMISEVLKWKAGWRGHVRIW